MRGVRRCRWVNRVPGSPGPGGRGVGPVAVQDFGTVGAAGGGGAVRMEGDGPALLMDGHVVMVEAVQRAAIYAGLPAVGQEGHEVDGLADDGVAEHLQ